MPNTITLVDQVNTPLQGLVVAAADGFVTIRVDHDPEVDTILFAVNGVGTSRPADPLNSFTMVDLPIAQVSNAITYVFLDAGSQALPGGGTVNFEADLMAPTMELLGLTDLFVVDDHLADSSYLTLHAVANDFAGSVGSYIVGFTTEPFATLSLISGDDIIVSDGMANADGFVSLDLPGNLASGLHSAQLRLTDAAGNETTYVVNLDIHAEDEANLLIAGLDPGSDTGLIRTDGLTSNTQPVIRGIAEAGRLVVISVDGHTLTTFADSLGRFAVDLAAESVTLTEGIINFTVALHAGVEPGPDTLLTSSSFSFTIDTTPPPSEGHLVIAYSEGDLIVSSETVGDYVAAVETSGGSGTLAMANASGLTLFDLPESTFAWTFHNADAAGNWATTAIGGVSFDNGGPEITLSGTAADETLVVNDSSLDAGRLVGGGGADTYSITADGLWSIVETEDAEIDQLFVGQSYTTSAAIERATLADNAGASALAVLWSGRTTLYGNSAANTLNGGIGADRFFGGDGGDTYMVDNRNDQVREVSTHTGRDRLLTTVSYDIAGRHIEDLGVASPASLRAIDLWGNALGNTITGGAGDNRLYGRQGDDSISGGGGNDLLSGGAGVDTLEGGAGDDTYVVDDSDTVIDATGGGIDRVLVTGSGFFAAGGVEVERIEAYDRSSTASLFLQGNEFVNTLIGNAGDNELVGSGNDMLRGLSGNDVYFVSAGDRIIETAGGGYDKLIAGASYTLAQDVSVEELQSNTSAAMILTGNDLANRLVGSGNHVDQLIGGGGNDTLVSGVGAVDSMTGGAGADRFVTSAVVDSMGTTLASDVGGATLTSGVATDFVAGTDLVQFDCSSDFAFSADLTAGLLTSDRFELGTEATLAETRFIYDQSTGTLQFDGDGSGTDLSAITVMQLTPGLSLTTSDITINVILPG